MINNLKLIIFDFDGVLTDNSVFLDSTGNEYVKCNRSDGLGFNALSKIGLKTVICSTEINKVVQARGQKLNVETFNAIEDKLSWLKNYCLSMNISPGEILYVGNDINDYKSMKFCGFSACPSDSAKEIKGISTFILNKKGGEGVVREIVESILKIDLLEILYGDRELNNEFGIK